MFKRVIVLSILVTVIAAVTASAAQLDVDGGVIQVFHPETNIVIPSDDADLETDGEDVNVNPPMPDDFFTESEPGVTNAQTVDTP